MMHLANCKQNGVILFTSDFSLIITNNYYAGSTNDAFESPVANAVSREE
jgi:hypothetical protein